MADYLDFTGLSESDRAKLFSNGGVNSLLGTMPYGAVPFALAGNMPASSWANSAATVLGAPIDATKWAARQAGIQNNLNGAPIADVPGGSDTWRAVLGGTPTPTQQPPPGSSFNAPAPQAQPQQQQAQDPSRGNPGEVAGFLGTPVDAATYFLRMVGLPVPKDAPFGSESWQRMLDHYNQANRPSPPLTWDDIITAARRAR
jgi:hypothetical protein